MPLRIEDDIRLLLVDYGFCFRIKYHPPDLPCEHQLLIRSSDCGALRVIRRIRDVTANECVVSICLVE